MERWNCEIGSNASCKPGTAVLPERRSAFELAFLISRSRIG
jgi:hypothetical protein